MRSGSFVLAGAGAFRADAVGDDAYAAKIASEGRKFTRTRSDLQEGIGLILKAIGVIIVPVGALTLWAQLRTAPDLTVAVTNTVAALVGMVPEGLVLLTSVAFAVAAIRLARQGVLTQELPAVEALARVDVVCADKTGTLTEPRPAFDRVEPLSVAKPEVTAALGALAGLSPVRNATADAIAAAVGVPEGWRLTASVPFSSVTKWSAASFAGRGTWVLGAPAAMLQDGAVLGSEALEARAGQVAATGSRVLLLARTEAALGDGEALPGGLVPAALVVLSERIRPDAAGAVRYFTDQSVAVKVISGDDPATVAAIAAIADVPDADASIDARELPSGDGPDALPALGAAMERYAVFGRVVPEQKRGFVRALQQQGHTVAMTGDGVNDVLALKQADLGIAMGSGAAATRAVAQLVMLDGRFAALPGVVAEGRRVTANAERVANLFLTKTVWATVLALFTALAAVPFPFLPRQLTLVGTLTIGVPAFFLALAPNSRRYVPGFVGRVVRFALPSGVIVAAAVFASTWASARLGADALQTRTVATIVLTLCGLAVIEVIERPLTGWRLGIVAAMLVGLIGSIAIAPVRDFFALTIPPLGPTAAGIAAAGAAWALLSVAARFAGPRERSA
jgi:cation-transporting ATPase E